MTNHTEIVGRPVNGRHRPSADRRVALLIDSKHCWCMGSNGTRSTKVSLIRAAALGATAWLAAVPTSLVALVPLGYGLLLYGFSEERSEGADAGGIVLGGVISGLALIGLGF